MRRLIVAAVLAAASLAAVPVDLARGAAPGTPSPNLPAPSVSLESARTVAPGTLVRLVGYVVGSYLCPPCPPGAICKPCAAPSEIFLASSPDHLRVILMDPASDVFALTVADPDAFPLGQQYRFELTTADRKADGYDGRMIRSQRPDDPVWPDASTERPSVVPKP